MSDCIGCGKTFDSCIIDDLCINCWREKATISTHDLAAARTALAEAERANDGHQHQITQLAKAISDKNREISEKEGEVERLRADLAEMTEHRDACQADAERIFALLTDCRAVRDEFLQVLVDEGLAPESDSPAARQAAAGKEVLHDFGVGDVPLRAAAKEPK